MGEPAGPRRAAGAAAGLGACLVLACALRLLAGPEGLAPPDSPAVWAIRLTRVVGAAVVGASLACAGVMLQAALRNPLAAPSVLGLTTGAGFAVALTVFAAGAASQALLAAPFAAAGAGALAALALVLLLARRRGGAEPLTLILVGVIVSSIFSAATMFLQHLTPDAGLALTSRWLLGAISDDIHPAALTLAAVLTAAGVGAGIVLGPRMDAACLSDDEAFSLGVDPARLRLLLLVIAGLLTAAATALAGPIAFVGLLCPHMARLLAGPAHRPLTPLAAVAGAALLVLADAVVRLVDLGAGRMPIGVLTALVGGPAFLVLLQRKWRTLMGAAA